MVVPPDTNNQSNDSEVPQPWSILNFRFSRTGHGSLKLSIDQGGSEFGSKSSLRRNFSQAASRIAVPLGGQPPAPAMKSGVRKKPASQTHLKINVLLSTNSYLQALRVQNENMSERENPIFRQRAGSPACGGGAYEEEDPRAARSKF